MMTVVTHNIKLKARDVTVYNQARGEGKRMGLISLHLGLG